ncbi:MAG TPA: EamA family transporter [Beijerinckiaceae bacterium]|nr:EamA family transporter [Beijerinckiaceae bacterium]
MQAVHIFMAVVVAAIWGFNFVVIQWGLESFPPILMASLRFAVAALPALVMPRPPVPMHRLVFVGTAWFAAQFGLLYLGMHVGMPPGLASVLMQAQAFFTILFAALWLGERPSIRQIAGVAVAAAGVVAIGSTVAGQGSDMTWPGLALVMTASACWALGNVMMRGMGRVEFLPMVVWLSAVAPLPLLALSLILEGPSAIAAARWDWSGIASIVFQGAGATIAGYGMWAYLLKLYPASVVAPFSLLVPLFGVASAALVFGEAFGPLRVVGIALILAGLAAVALPKRWFSRGRTAA